MLNFDATHTKVLSFITAILFTFLSPYESYAQDSTAMWAKDCAGKSLAACIDEEQGYRIAHDSSNFPATCYISHNKDLKDGTVSCQAGEANHAPDNQIFFFKRASRPDGFKDYFNITSASALKNEILTGKEFHLHAAYRNKGDNLRAEGKVRMKIAGSKQDKSDIKYSSFWFAKPNPKQTSDRRINLTRLGFNWVCDYERPDKPCTTEHTNDVELHARVQWIGQPLLTGGDPDRFYMGENFLFRLVPVSGVLIGNLARLNSENENISELGRSSRVVFFKRGTRCEKFRCYVSGQSYVAFNEIPVFVLSQTKRSGDVALKIAFIKENPDRKFSIGEQTKLGRFVILTPERDETGFEFETTTDRRAIIFKDGKAQCSNVFTGMMGDCPSGTTPTPFSFVLEER